MRHSVRKARIHIVRKLIKQVKIFGGKKGDDQQREKYKRKADKLGEELAVLKKLKDDEISRFSITNDRNLQEILTDQKSDAEMRALARLASHKVISDRVVKFKEKFPNYEEHLGPGKRKLMKLKRKAGKQAKKEAKVTAQISEERKEGIIEKEDSMEDNDSVGNERDIDVRLSENQENIELPESAEEKLENEKRKADENSSSHIKRIKTTIKNPPEVKKREKSIRSIKEKEEGKGNDKLSGISITNKESTVKSFSRFLEEKDAEVETDKKTVGEEIENENELEIEKEVDSFFMTDGGSGEYLSVVVPKSKTTENEEEEEEENAKAIEMGDRYSSRSRNNNRFFDKVDNRFDKTNKNINNNRERSNFVRGDRFKDRNESRGFNNNRNMNKDIKSKRERDFTKSDKSITENAMHPSWAAKKKQQEMLKLGFQGKKIVFDDA